MKTLKTISVTNARKALCFFLLIHCMIYIGLAQGRTVQPEQDPDREELSDTKATPDKSTPIRLKVVGGGAMIHDLTVGRGGGNYSVNSAFGQTSLFSNTSGIYCTAIGAYALRYNTTGSYNTAIGNDALYSNTTGQNNTAIGSYALTYNTTGRSNIAVGRGPLAFNTSGYSSIAIGGRALYSNTNRSNLVAVGDSALFNNGNNASSAEHATANTALGSKTLYSNTTGYMNTATGYHALYTNTTGRWNTASGNEALLLNTSGSCNTAMGNRVLHKNTTGSHNTAIGNWTLNENTIGFNNTAVGSNALNKINTQTGNTAIGVFAGAYYTFSSGTFVGNQAYPNANGYTNVTGIGFSAMSTASNQVRIGNTAVGSIGGHANWTNFSDGGYKSFVSEEVAGLDFILRLRPVSYNLDVHKLAADLGEDIRWDEEGNKSISSPDEITLKSRNEKASIRYTGFIAQEVEAAVNELGVAFSGVDAPANKSSYYGLRYAEFVVPLVKAVQEQQAQIDLLEPAVVEALQMELQEVKEKNLQLEEKNRELESKVDQILSLLKQQGFDLGSITTGGPSRPDASRSGRYATSQGATLEQNNPNPFHENTVIRYYVPENSGKAQIVVTDLQGNRIQTFDISSIGQGQVPIQGGSLPSGTYIYSLIISGQVADSKRMVLL